MPANLYRLDPALPTDPLWRTLRTSEQATTRGAIPAAIARAKRMGVDVTISQISGRTLRVLPVRTVSPDGTVNLVTNGRPR
jgi:hypothetical protein